MFAQATLQYPFNNSFLFESSRFLSDPPDFSPKLCGLTRNVNQKCIQ